MKTEAKVIVSTAIAVLFGLIIFVPAEYYTPARAWPAWAILLAMLAVAFVAIVVRKDQAKDPLTDYAVAVRRWISLNSRLRDLEETARVEFERWKEDQNAQRYDYLQRIITEAGPLLLVAQEIESFDKRKRYPVLMSLDDAFAEVQHFCGAGE